ncbi:MAG: hypothetical protein EOO68_19010 [Moraxellaceae bacterium]|nr:MAG: hypothetical protein EOO68_19010 [Moraxellaceae bacterium]
MYKLNMYKPKLLILLVLTCFSCSSLCAKEIVFAFDKTLAHTTSLDGMARSQMLVRNLAKVDVKQSMFLIRTKDVTPKTIDRLSFYDQTGQLIVNAGAKYSLYSISNPFAYAVDILKADTELAQYANYRRHIYFPYLYEGGDVEALSNLQEFLSDHLYQPTYVTYKANDDYLDLLYQARVATNKPVNIRELEKVYVELLIQDILAYDAKANLLLGYSPRQVILLHENDLAAYFIIGLVDALNARGFKVISPEKVFSDPVANPFFVSGYSATGYMKSLTGFSEARSEKLYILSSAQQQKIHALLTAHGLADLIPATESQL